MHNNLLIQNELDYWKQINGLKIHKNLFSQDTTKWVGLGMNNLTIVNWFLNGLDSTTYNPPVWLKPTILTPDDVVFH